MPFDSRIAALPAVRKLAEEQAREELSALFIVAQNFNIFGPSLVEVHLRLLADMSRPASRRELAALVAPHLAGGVDVGWLISAIEAGSSDELRGETWRHARKYAGLITDADTAAERCALISMAVLS